MRHFRLVTRHIRARRRSPTKRCNQGNQCNQRNQRDQRNKAISAIRAIKANGVRRRHARRAAPRERAGEWHTAGVGRLRAWGGGARHGCRPEDKGGLLDTDAHWARGHPASRAPRAAAHGARGGVPRCAAAAAACADGGGGRRSARRRAVAVALGV
eukprot:6503023-Prymnesium_polylepis.2